MDGDSDGEVPGLTAEHAYELTVLPIASDGQHTGALHTPEGALLRPPRYGVEDVLRRAGVLGSPSEDAE